MIVPVVRSAATRHLHRHTRTLFVSAPSASSDPWPLPHTPQHLSSTTTPTDIPAPEPLPRSNESLETMRARLLYQSRKRGTLESDLLLSTFARDHLPTMTRAELSEYDKVHPLSSCLCTLDEGLLGSYWMSPTGIYTTGRRAIARRRNDTPTYPSWKNSKCMRRTRERSCGRCLLWSNSYLEVTRAADLMSEQT